MPAVSVVTSAPSLPPPTSSSSGEDLSSEAGDYEQSSKALLQLGMQLCRNASQMVDRLKPRPEYDDSSNAFLYIVFVLMFYACSIVILMIKYIRREREGVKLEYYYDEFVKREAFQYRLFDKTGRLIPLPSHPSIVPRPGAPGHAQGSAQGSPQDSPRPAPPLAPQPSTSGAASPPLRPHRSVGVRESRRGSSSSSSSGAEDIVPSTSRQVRVYTETNV